MGSGADAAIGMNLRRLRLERGWERDVLAKLAGVDRLALAAYEAGELRVPAEALYDMAVTLEVPISAFFENADIVGIYTPMTLQPVLH